MSEWAALALTQTQLTVLRKIVETVRSIPEGQTTEFLVNVTHNDGTSLLFQGKRGVVIPVAQSDLNQLIRSGCIFQARLTSRGTEVLQLENKVFQLFREDETDSLPPMRFDTGDRGLDDLLDVAITRYKLHDAREREDALKTLWDAWERLKTLESGDKKAGADALLDRAASEPTFRAVIGEESKVLTGIGNNFRIRHHETYKVDLSDPYQVDYFFERMLAMIRLLLRKSGRM